MDEREPHHRGGEQRRQTRLAQDVARRPAVREDAHDHPGGGIRHQRQIDQGLHRRAPSSDWMAAISPLERGLALDRRVREDDPEEPSGLRGRWSAHRGSGKGFRTGRRAAGRPWPCPGWSRPVREELEPSFGRGETAAEVLPTRPPRSAGRTPDRSPRPRGRPPPSPGRPSGSPRAASCAVADLARRPAVRSSRARPIRSSGIGHPVPAHVQVMDDVEEPLVIIRIRHARPERAADRQVHLMFSARRG